MKQYTENQYDDDLTVGTDEYDDSYYTGSVDLFEFSNDEESPISRLKSLVLSIDWEITDEILMQFNEELVDLRDIWAGEKINLVYVQALEKISKYIYQKKADSHPSAIKLLLTLYHNLEKIVSSFDLTDEQKKEILLEDVKRFESLKRHIAQPSQAAEVSQKKQQEPQEQAISTGTGNDLLNLKAIVLGIDWEITDQDLSDLRQEVIRLEGVFTGSRPKLILLQGIGTLGAYIKLKKSNAHADAFKILHLFYESLEKIVTTPMKLEEEKAILFPAVEKFNSFKTLLGPTIDAETISRDVRESDEYFGPTDSVAIEPAFADFPDEETVGFQAEEEAQALGIDNSGSIDNQVENFFTGQGFQDTATGISSGGIDTVNRDLHERALQGVDVEEEVDGLLAEHDKHELIAEKIQQQPVEEVKDTSLSIGLEDDEKPIHDFSKLDRDVVLQGVDVETEADDDSDEEALPLLGGELAPALAENDEVSIFNEEKFEQDSLSETIDDEIAGTLGGFFDEEIESHIPAVKHEEDSSLTDPESTTVSEESVPLEVEKIEDVISETIPEAEDEPVFSVSELETEESFDSIGDSDFEQSVEEPLPEDIFLQGVDVETEADDDSDEEALPMLGDDLAPALVENDEVSIFNEEEVEHASKLENIDDEIAGTLGGFFDEEIEAHLTAVTSEDDSPALGVESEVVSEESVLLDDEDIISKIKPDVEDESITFASELETEEEGVDSFFADSGVEQSSEGRLEEDLFDEMSEIAPSEVKGEEDSFSEIDEPLDNIFELEDNVEEPVEDQLSFTLPEESIEDDILLENNLVPPVSNDVQEEEVVFELVEEVGQLLETESDIEISDTPPIEEFLSAEEDLFSSDPVFEDEGIEDISDDLVSTYETEKDTEAYGSLQTCVDSLGIELDHKVILGLLGEIDYLQEKLADKPLEQTFLQLIKTVTRHIDQNRYDSSSLAYGLLKSSCRALSDLQEDDVHQNLETLLVETRKVLNWQEEILAQQAERNEAELTIGDSMSSDQESAQGYYDESAQSYDTKQTSESDELSGVVEHQDNIADTTLDNVFDQTDSGEAKRLDETTESLTGWEDTKMLTDDLKQEISTLRQTLQDEIAELRKELKGNYP